ncbi:MAG: hypothetical protein ABR511_06730 [Acidimicrobiales bacterium]
MTSRRAAAVLAGALVAAGCGGSSHSVSSGTTTSTAAAVTTTTTVPSTVDPAKANQAKAAILQLNDLPAGFQATDPTDGSGLHIDKVWADITSCLGLPAPGGTSSVEAASTTFTRGIATQAMSAVEYTATPAAPTVGTALNGPKSQDCLTGAFTTDLKASAPSGGTPGKVTIAPLDGVPQVGDSVFARRMTAPIDLGGGFVVHIVEDMVVVFKGTTMVRMLFLDPGGVGFPQDLEHTLIQQVVSRS